MGFDPRDRKRIEDNLRRMHALLEDLDTALSADEADPEDANDLANEIEDAGRNLADEILRAVERGYEE